MTKFIQTGKHDAGHLSIRSGQVVGNYYFGSMTRSVIDCLRAFDRQLYFGHMHRDVFLYGHYLHAKESLILEMMDLDAQSEDRIRNLGFCMYMSRVAQRQQWKYPALLNRDPAGRISQITGSTRAFASMLVHERPWEHYPILLAEHPDFDPNDLLKDPLLVDSDLMLHEIFGLDPQATTWDAPVEINLMIEKSPGGLWCRLDYVGNGTYHDHNPEQGQALLDEYQKWRMKYPSPIPLAVYTDWPDLLINRQHIWDVEIVGSSKGMLMDDRPATVERSVRSYHQSPTHPHDHVLWIVAPRPIDLGDLLFWMDDSHSTYISNDWQFIMWRRQQEYQNTFINVSRPGD